MPDRLSQIFAAAVEALAQGKIPSPRLEARLMFSAAFGDDVDLSPKAQDNQLAVFNSMLTRRLAHVPLCKILGRKGFYKSDFFVTEDVLSPRPDTEILVEAAIKIAQEKCFRQLVDFGAGSGCILLSVLGDVPQAFGIGVDISAKALQVASKNAATLGLQERCRFLNAGWFDENICAHFPQPIDMILSNPPYIPSQDILALEKEVREHDPLLALDGGEDGLRDYRRLAEIAPLILKPGGYVLLEVGIGQADDVVKIFTSHGLHHVETLADLGSIPRCIILHN